MGLSLVFAGVAFDVGVIVLSFEAINEACDISKNGPVFVLYFAPVELGFSPSGVLRELVVSSFIDIHEKGIIK